MPGTIKNGKICHHRTKLSEEFCRKEFIEPTEELEKVVFVPDVRSGLITTLRDDGFQITTNVLNFPSKFF